MGKIEIFNKIPDKLKQSYAFGTVVVTENEWRVVRVWPFKTMDAKVNCVKAADKFVRDNKSVHTRRQVSLHYGANIEDIMGV